MYCTAGNKWNDTSMGEVNTYVTSVVLNNLLPYSWYDVTVAAYTVKNGTGARITAHTLELGNLYNLCIIFKGKKKDIQIYFVLDMDVRNQRWKETVCVFTVEE
jgi:hypothetical protein